MVTGSATAERVVPPTTALEDDPSEQEADVAALKAITQAATHLRCRYPTASDAQIRASVDEAFDRLRTARVRLYLAILIERSADRALAKAVEPGEPGR